MTNGTDGYIMPTVG